MSAVNPISDDQYSALEDRALNIFKHAAEDWLEDPAYQRLLRLGDNPRLQLCLAFTEDPQFAEWQDTDLLPEDLETEELVQFTLFYAALPEDAETDADVEPEEIAAKILLSAQENNDYCAVQWFPES